MNALHRILLIICGLELAAKSIPAQTWSLTVLPTNTWPAVAISADGSRMVAISFGSDCYRSANSGVTWTTNLEPQYGSSVAAWHCIASSADGRRLIAASAYNTIWTSVNAGGTWISNSVSGVNGWAAMTSSADGGRLAAADGVFAQGLIYTSTNGGLSWMPTSAPSNYWTSIASSADGSKLVATAGSPLGGYSTNGSIYTSTNFGATWTQTDAPSEAWASVASSSNGVNLIAASTSVYAGNNFASYGSIFTSTNAGKTWVSNNLPQMQWQSVATSADGTRLVAGAANLGDWIYVSTNSGITWLPNSLPTGGITSVASSADGSILIAAGSWSGVYTLYSTPRLAMVPTNHNLALSWLLPATNFVLQQAQNLNPSHWTILMNCTNLADGIIVTPTNGSSFYRLATP